MMRMMDDIDFVPAKFFVAAVEFLLRYCIDVAIVWLVIRICDGVENHVQNNGFDPLL